MTSNDNAYSEALFKTLKYSPAFPARPWVAQFVHWYNEAHRHSALRFVTPAQRHRGADQALLAQREAVYARAKAEKRQRWAGETRNWQPVGAVALNPNKAPTQEVPSHTEAA